MVPVNAKLGIINWYFWQRRPSSGGLGQKYAPGARFRDAPRVFYIMNLQARFNAI